LLSYDPFTAVTNTVATANPVTFVLTSADSGSVVTSYLIAGGREDIPGRQGAMCPHLIVSVNRKSLNPVSTDSKRSFGKLFCSSVANESQ
jgi:hypothetical protein